jgi:3-hydroxybutyryl-CoA dehydrogenase
MNFARVLVVGAGQMGGGIAQVVASSGREVLLYDPLEGAAERALATIARSLERLAAKGGVEPAGVLGRIEPVAELVPAELMLEAIVEDLDAKRELFARVDALLPPGAVLASNTSSLPIGALAAATGRPAEVIGMHFFNPVPVLALVEVVRGPATSAATNAAILALARELGKVPVEAQDAPGFVSNRILMPFVNEAVRTLAAGVASAEAIDTVAQLGFGHPLGPLALADLIGLDTCVAIMEVLARGLADASYAPAPLLRAHVAAGRLGRKSGQGFYRYDAHGGRVADGPPESAPPAR